MAAVNPPIPLLSATQMLRHGCLLIGIDKQSIAKRKRSTLVDDFKSHFGPHPLHAARVWRDLLTCQQTCPAAFVNPAEADIDAFFFALYFLRCYPKERVRAIRLLQTGKIAAIETRLLVAKQGALTLIVE